MVQTLKNLTFILALGAIVFWLARNHISNLIKPTEFRRWRNTWFSIQTIAFLSPSIWLFYSVVALIVTKVKTHDSVAALALFAFLLSTLPALGVEIPGFGIVNYIFTLSYPRILSILILLPLFLKLINTNDKNDLRSKSTLDKLVIGYIVLITIMEGSQSTATDALRMLFLNFIDYFLPYYVTSRVIRSKEDFDRILMAMLLAISISALIGIFESVKNWHLYNHLVQELLGWKRLTSSDVRGDILRSSATFMSPIVLGYVITIALGIFLYFNKAISNKFLRLMVFWGLVIGLVSTVSRGPWVGFAILIIVFIWTGKDRISNLAKLGFAGLLSLPLIIASPYGQKFVSLLPFIGDVRSDTIDYREQLLEVSWQVFKKNPILGDIHFRDTTEMESLRQGQGIIDVVNTYVGVALNYGSVGLFLFLMIFIVAITKTYKITKMNRNNERLNILGRSLTAILVSIALIIFTVSSINYIPWYYWTLIGLSSAYHRNYYRQIRSALNKNHQMS